MRILCCVNHYYNPTGQFNGKSTWQAPDVRKGMVQTALATLRKFGSDMTIEVCGVPGSALVPIDRPFMDLADPQHLVFATLERMAALAEKFDYFLNIEDDIEVPPCVLHNAIQFDEEGTVAEVFHPNRMEEDEEGPFCVDLRVWPGWTGRRRVYGSLLLSEAENPHSAFLFLSRAKIVYMRDRINLAFRGRIDGFPGGPMATAYCHAHTPFTLWRSPDPRSNHVIRHLDRWDPNARSNLRSHRRLAQDGPTPGQVPANNG